MTGSVDGHVNPAERSGRPTPARPSRPLRWLLRAPLRIYDWHLGWLLGHRFLRLTHRGRRSGRRYQTVLEVVGRDQKHGEYVVMAGFGRASDWYQNIQAGPEAAEIEIGREHFVPDLRVLDPDEAAATLASYERRNRLAAPIVRRVLGRLIGERYDGSEAARREVVRLLPMIGFRPRTGI